MYSKDISNKVKSALKAGKEQGKYIGSTTAYGYMKDPNNKYQLIINPEEAEVVKLIFRLYLEGKGLTKIAQILTEKNIEVPGKSRNCRINDKTSLYDCWKQTTISRILRNQVYIGNLEQGKRKTINYKLKIRITVPKEERIIKENAHEPIIDKETFEHVQELLLKNSSFSGKKHDYLFKGLLYCGDCGAKMYLTYSHYALEKYGEYRYTTMCYTYSKLYNKCTRHSNNLKKLEPLLLKKIKEVCSLYLNQNLSQELVELANAENENSKTVSMYTKKIAELDKKIEEVSLCIKNLYMDKVKGIIDEEEFINLSKDFSDEKKQLLKEKEDYSFSYEESKAKRKNSVKIEKMAKEFISLKKPSKDLLTRLVDKITITEDNIVTIYFKFKELNEISLREENIMYTKTSNKRNKKVG